jgi:hypothetical protein
VGRIAPGIHDRPVALSDTWEKDRVWLSGFLNREVLPALKSIRRTINGPMYSGGRTRAGAYQILMADELILGDTTDEAGSFTLPPGAPNGTVFTVVDAVGNASVNNITVSTSSEGTVAEFIEGATSVVLSDDYGYMGLLKVSETKWIEMCCSDGEDDGGVPTFSGGFNAGEVVVEDDPG